MKHIKNRELFENLNSNNIGKNQIIKESTKYGFWDGVVDMFLPGTPVKDGKKILRELDDLIEIRIKYNKKYKLPIDTLTVQEKKFREKIFAATPLAADAYPDVKGMTKILKDIQLGKSIQNDEIYKYKTDMSKYRSKKDIETLIGTQNEIKKMWLGIDGTGPNNGYWINSEFKPQTSQITKQTYTRPKTLVKFNQIQFDLLYNAILTTKRSDGTFPGGNSETVENLLMRNYGKKPGYEVLINFLDDSSEILGKYKLGAGIDKDKNNKKYISVYDIWDLVPGKISAVGVDINKYSKTPVIYYRIYRP